MNSLTISGIQCDNNTCDYTNSEVSFQDYELWLNKPCPCCGENLLTEADFNTVKLMGAVVQIANAVSPTNNVDEPIITSTIKMNGSGTIELTDTKIKD